MEGVFSIRHCIKKQILYIIFICYGIIIVSGCSHDSKGIEEMLQVEEDKSGIGVLEEDKQQLKKTEIIEEPTSCFVYICGAVKNPDVYEVNAGARIYEVVKKAGGFSKNADETAVNLAEQVFDGQQVYIPTREEKKQKEGNLPEQSDIESSSKLDLNTATKEQLMTLPGVGEAKADSILAYREEHGKFRSIEELKEIRGIKDRVFQKMKDKIIVH